MTEEKETTTAPKRGIRKYVPQPEQYAARYGVFTLTARDVEIIDLVYQYRHLESRHIRALIGGSEQKITRRLQGLFHNLYLARYVPREKMRLELGQGSPQIAYGLETEGLRVLKAHRQDVANGDEEPEPVNWKKDHTRRMEGMLRHKVMTSHFHCVLELALRDAAQDIALVEWDQSQNNRSYVKFQDGREFVVTPDAYFSIEAAGGIHNFYIELDRSSEDRWRIAEKYEKYWWWLQSPAYQEAHHDHKRVSVLFVSTGEQRLSNMMDVLRGVPYIHNRKTYQFDKPNDPPYGGKGWFCFCLEDDYQLEDPSTILAPIWRTVTRSNRLRGLL